MTPEDRELDSAFFLEHQPLILFRLARAKYANLSGIGAALAPGRWNAPGEEAIYTSTEMGVPLLERLVHCPKDLIPSNLALMKISVSGRWEARSDALIDADTKGRLWIYRSLSEARRAFLKPRIYLGGIKPFAIAVPSVIVPVWNVVLYPQRVGFWEHVSLLTLEPFEFDPRLFPEETPTESHESA